MKTNEAEQNLSRLFWPRFPKGVPLCKSGYLLFVIKKSLLLEPQGDNYYLMILEQGTTASSL